MKFYLSMLCKNIAPETPIACRLFLLPEFCMQITLCEVRGQVNAIDLARLLLLKNSGIDRKFSWKSRPNCSSWKTSANTLVL